jgi:DNA polymerase-3 subunit delta
MVVLKIPSANKEFVDVAPDLLKALPETTDVIIIEPKLDKRLSYYKFLKQHSDYHECNELDEAGLAKWLIAQAEEQGGTLSRADATYLVERVGAIQQLLANELAKLLSHSPDITRQTIDILTDQTPQSTIFELLDAALAGRTQRALQLYAEQRAMKVEPQAILAMLAWQFHVLAVVKAAGNRDPGTIAKEAKLNPFVVRKSQATARKLEFEQIKHLIHSALELDIRLKSQPIDADEAVLYLLSSIV